MLSIATIKSYLKSEQCCVLIPTYNNAGTIKEVVDSVAVYTDDIIVVNDGSTDSTLEILQSIQGLDFISFPDNRGKGLTLRRGFDYAYSKGFKYAISIDSDGQHYADDLSQFVEKLKDNKNAIIVGERNMAQAGIPRKSSVGHKFSNFWFRLETGINLPDTQSGYRLYPLVPLQKLKFYTVKYEFEIEVMVRASWRGVNIVSTPVKVFYAPPGERITHFRPFTDFTRIFILNTVLVILAVLYHIPVRVFKTFQKKKWKQIVYDAFANESETPIKKSYAVAFGVFMGIFPIWGYQILTALALAHIFKLNKVLVVLASNISIPPMIPLILLLSYKTGIMMLGGEDILLSSTITWEILKDNLMPYLLGSVVLAFGAAIAFGITTFLVLSCFGNKLVKQI